MLKHLKYNAIFILLTVLACFNASAEVPGDYYSNTDGLTGNALAEKLQEITASNHRPLTYKEIWSLIEETDEDINNANNIYTLYSGESIPKRCRVGGLQAQDCPGLWNREHVWAKSHGFPRENQWAYTDGHHLRAANEYCNDRRGTLDFAEGGDVVARCGQSRRSNTAPRTWEPANEAKGNIARMMFYMAVRYNGNVIDQTPDLKLVDYTTQNSRPEFGKLCTLLKWHKTYPVSPAERRRNDIVYRVQGNRNPFIDVPAFAEKIWSAQCEGTP